MSNYLLTSYFSIPYSILNESEELHGSQSHSGIQNAISDQSNAQWEIYVKFSPKMEIICICKLILSLVTILVLFASLSIITTLGTSSLRGKYQS